MSDAISSAQSGRNAAIARRVAMSAGKAALPPATERVSVGRRGAVLPAAHAASPVQAAPIAAETPPPSAPTVSSAGALSGRNAAIERRRLLSAGKAALGAAAKPAAAPASVPAPAFGASESAPAICADTSCRAQARARRAALSQHGRGDAPAAVPARTGKLEYAPKVTESPTQAGQRVTGLRIGQGQQVTGDQRGTGQPVSGTQYIAAEGGGAWRAGGPKVGHARTDAGLVVSGTMVRSKVRITGDEAGAGITITGKADQRLDDDVTQRTDQGAYGATQFQRQANPHGGAVFAGNLGRSARSVGSRERSREVLLESTDKGMPITGSALGRSLRVTGDEGGACRSVTGTQYLAPARRQTACGFAGGGTAPADQSGADRADAVTAGKVTVAQSWGGQRITGFDVEHHPSVTGDAPGSCAPLTGSQYQGRVTMEGFCGAGAAGAAAARRAHGAGTAVTGNTPLNVEAVSGTARGAGRDITGTPYYRAEPAVEAPAGGAVAALDDRFSVKSPQRGAQLRAAARVVQPDETAAGRITGSCAGGNKKITGNLEFLVRPRSGASPDRPPAHTRISGEGRAAGGHITGDSWGDQKNVTGTDGAFAADRNPSIRGPKAKPFAGAATFKGEARHEEPKQLVTGMFGYFSKTGARVTLSGGAQS